MLKPQFILPLADELVVDLFAGGGGASTGIEQAIGRHVDIAVNHDPAAVSLHQANHPQTQHFVCDVFEVDPRVVADGRPIGLLWASPDCKHFSKAKGGKPVSKKIRGLAGVVVEWVERLKPLDLHPRLIYVENVEEFQTWGPLGPDNRPCPVRKGQSFRRWIGALVRLGYVVEWRELRACDYGAPTSRKRLLLIARRDGQPIVWPEPTHAKNPAKDSGLLPWRTAAECIDWSLPCPSIFERERPLAEATLRRIAHGVKRYVLEAAKPFIVRIGHTGHGDAGKARAAAEPLHTVTAGGDAARPSTGNVMGLVASSLVKLRGTSNSASSTAPLATVSAQGFHHAEVRAFLIRYFGSDQDPKIDGPLATVTTKHRDALVTVHGEDYLIADIGMRMLQPRELYRAQGFPDSYVIDRGADGRVLTKAEQVRMCGNSVCPPMARALVLANYAERQALRRAA